MTTFVTIRTFVLCLQTQTAMETRTESVKDDPLARRTFNLQQIYVSSLETGREHTLMVGCARLLRLTGDLLLWSWMYCAMCYVFN